MNDQTITFGQYIKQRREALGMTLRDVANAVKVSAAYISDIERGSRGAPDRYLDALAEALRLTDKGERYDYYDLAGKSKCSHSDINSYLDTVPYARVALRTAKDHNFTDKDWEVLLDVIEKKRSADN